MIFSVNLFTGIAQLLEKVINILDWSYSYMVYLVKMESESEIPIFGLKILVKWFFKFLQCWKSFSDPLTYFIKG